MPDMVDTINHCSFCEKHKDKIGKLIVSHNVAICNECVDLCQSLLTDNKKAKPEKQTRTQTLDPHDIKDYLDQYVVGQDQAKKVLSVKILN